MVTVIPIPSLGGSTKDSILTALDISLRGVRNAIESLKVSAPHMRDYIGRDAAYRKAIGEHEDRMSKLVYVKNDLEEMQWMVATDTFTPDNIIANKEG